jgi:hypothetical protein
VGEVRGGIRKVVGLVGRVVWGRIEELLRGWRGEFGNWMIIFNERVCVVI